MRKIAKCFCSKLHKIANFAHTAFGSVSHEAAQEYAETEFGRFALPTLPFDEER